MPSDSELAKKLSGGAITKREYDRLMAMPHNERYAKSKNKGLKERSGAAVTPAEMKRYAAGMREPGKSSGKPKTKGGKPHNPHRGAY